MGPGADTPLTTRQRYRAQVRDEVKSIALRQLAESGPAGVSVNAIAKELGVSGPALYRYFESRDALLTELVIDAYDDLADALREAVATKKGRGARVRFEALAWAFRAWAVAQPDRYRLLYTPPLPGYDSHAERLIEAGQASMNILVDILRDADEPDAPRLARGLSLQLSEWAHRRGIDIDAPRALHAIVIWSRLHGLVSLEIGGNFQGMGIDAEALFEREVARMAPSRG
jgi:AcrR family transcriptional regulator